jgi:PTH2 family peptidyl-tRNA hydrolase
LANIASISITENKKMRRVFIIRKDLNMSSGKLAAQIGHCSEIYWLHKIQRELFEGEYNYFSDLVLDKEEVDEYINGKIIKTVCQCKNLNQLLKAKTICEELGLKEGYDFGFVNDACLTELQPENENGTCTTCFWTKPLPDEIAHKISKKYHLYTD